MYRFKSFLPLLFAGFLYSCCGCTEQLCLDGGSPMLRLLVDLNDYPELSEADFDSVYVIRTDKSFASPDSVLERFFPVDISSSTLNLPLSLEMFFIEGEQISDYNFIVYNASLGQTDTISNITYQIVQSEEVCNECDGVGLHCKDEMYIRNNFESASLQYNEQTINSFDINWMRK